MVGATFAFGNCGILLPNRTSVPLLEDCETGTTAWLQASFFNFGYP